MQLQLQQLLLFCVLSRSWLQGEMTKPPSPWPPHPAPQGKHQSIPTCKQVESNNLSSIYPGSVPRPLPSRTCSKHLI